MATKFQLSPLAATGFSDASKYDTHRPSYPPEAVEKLISNLKLSGIRNARVIDLASGTGKFTELLAKREENFEIVAVEPHPQLRRELITKGLRGVSVKEGNAGNMGIEEGWADGVITAQSIATRRCIWHDLEYRRLYTPPIPQIPPILTKSKDNAPKDWKSRVPWEEKLKQIIASFEDGHPRFRHGKWREVFETREDTNHFQTIKGKLTGNFPNFSLLLGEESVEWTVWLGDEAVWDRFSTLSQIANTKENGDKFEEIKREVFKALKGEGVERNERGEVEVHGRTYFTWTSRT
ncbi:hypothetical protein BGZ60DRAFT_468651 [Tricladium varicosporioides]|nr:hypothetical protein BGZ60DRAFT_468651 [Hymenoscyphus varicosporioides]